LGRHRKPSRIVIPAVAAPALVSVAAAICLSPQAASASTTTPQITPQLSSQHAVVTDAVSFPGAAFASLPAAVKTAAHTKASSGLLATYKVKSGDTLSTIAQHFYHESAAWPVIYYANRSKIHWADEISVGETLKIPVKPAKIPAAPGSTGPAASSSGSSSSSSSSSSGSSPSSASVQTDARYSGSGSFQSCVISRESGGNSQVMNSSGHYGLYQFSESTWEAYGGSAASFGNASVAEQNQVFDNAIAQGGESNWSAYDGC
jgi:Transglycosylase-like domain/LysM domain